MDNPIFAAAGYMERVWHEIDQLADAIVENLDRENIKAIYQRHDSANEDHTARRSLYDYKLRKAYTNQKSDAQIALYFDLHRDGQPTSWPPSQEALLIVGYDKSFDNGWAFDHLGFYTDGTLRDPDARSSVFPLAESGNRLLVWDQDDANAPWHRRCWAFALPLRELTDPDEVEKQITSPFVALLKGKGLRETFLSSKAIEWPSR